MFNLVFAMASIREKVVKDEIIDIGKKLYIMRLVSARTGNLSAKLDRKNILITATGSCLGNLKYNDIIKVNLDNELDTKNRRVSSEFPLHRLIYKSFPVRRIIHCHPPLVNGYFSVYSNLRILTLEAKVYLGAVPVIEQEHPAVTRPKLLLDALKKNNLVAMRNHGVVSVGENFTDALYLIETLEAAVKVAAIVRLFKKDILDSLDKGLKEDLMKDIN